MKISLLVSARRKNMIKNQLEKVFERYQMIYKKILVSNRFYPSLDSTGFQERNLTVNFSKAYEQVYANDNVISWFELQFGENKNNHFDCLIINMDRKEIFFIESKRFSNVKTKTSSVAKDIERIEGFVNKDRLVDNRFKDFSEFAINGVILADVWHETPSKIEVYEKFKTKTFFKGTKDGIYDVKTINNIADCRPYSLLSFVWKIK